MVISNPDLENQVPKTHKDIIKWVWTILKHVIINIPSRYSPVNTVYQGEDSKI